MCVCVSLNITFDVYAQTTNSPRKCLIKIYAPHQECTSLWLLKLQNTQQKITKLEKYNLLPLHAAKSNENEYEK